MSNMEERKKRLQAADAQQDEPMIEIRMTDQLFPEGTKASIEFDPDHLAAYAWEQENELLQTWGVGMNGLSRRMLIAQAFTGGMLVLASKLKMDIRPELQNAVAKRIAELETQHEQPADQDGPPSASDELREFVEDALNVQFKTPIASDPRPEKQPLAFNPLSLAELAAAAPFAIKEVAAEQPTGGDGYNMNMAMSFIAGFASLCAVLGLEVSPRQKQATVSALKAFLANVSDEDSWQQVFGVADDVTAEDLRAAFLARAEKAHPDNGGSEQAMERLAQAYTRALRDRRF